MFEGRPLRLVKHGGRRRDFTYVDDIVAGVLAAVGQPPERAGEAPPHRVYNLGNHRAEPLLRFVEVIEQTCGKAAIRELADMQPGDVQETYADIASAREDRGLEQRDSKDEGLTRLV